MLYQLSIVLLCVVGAWSALPGNLKPCKMGSNDYGDCLKTEITNAIKFFKSGNKKMGVHPIEPFRFVTMSVNQGTGPVTIKLDLKNFDMKGLSNIEIQEVKNDWKTMEIKAHLKELDCEGEYAIQGKVLMLPISGTGKCSIKAKELDLLAVLKMSEVTKGGKTYMQVDGFDVDINPKRAIFDFQNLFNGDKALGDNMNLFLNENHEEIVRELKPAISKGMSAGFTHLANQVLSRINAKDIK
ncbi:unnamed protein product [Nezara viridula]|uniref:Uncharacterized protein n=1 Tax=Nezara viridula TaxID=85310 RepID=A0A9P0MP42_NEZVI|nr:unnamed protein product [Nezara viridula]